MKVIVVCALVVACVASAMVQVVVAEPRIYPDQVTEHKHHHSHDPAQSAHLHNRLLSTRLSAMCVSLAAPTKLDLKSTTLAPSSSMYIQHIQRSVQRAVALSLYLYLFCGAHTQARVESMIAHNADPSNTWTRTINRFTDRTEAERKAVRGARLVRSQNKGIAEHSTDPLFVPLFFLPCTALWRCSLDASRVCACASSR